MSRSYCPARAKPTPLRGRLEREDELRDVLTLLARVELLLGVLTLVGVPDQEAVALAARVHRLDERRDTPLAVAAGRGRRHCRAGRRGSVRPGDAGFRPGAAEPEGLQRSLARGRRGGIQPQLGRVEDTALWDRRQREPDEDAQVSVAALRHELENRVVALV